ncbi:hypothetical protein PACTADRAFT_48106, partial [Pachysolen tannophilus NRRL Y-2460]
MPISYSDEDDDLVINIPQAKRLFKSYLTSLSQIGSVSSFSVKNGHSTRRTFINKRKVLQQRELNNNQIINDNIKEEVIRDQCIKVIEYSIRFIQTYLENLKNDENEKKKLDTLISLAVTALKVLFDLNFNTISNNIDAIDDHFLNFCKKTQTFIIQLMDLSKYELCINEIANVYRILKKLVSFKFDDHFQTIEKYSTENITPGIKEMLTGLTYNPYLPQECCNIITSNHILLLQALYNHENQSLQQTNAKQQQKFVSSQDILFSVKASSNFSSWFSHLTDSQKLNKMVTLSKILYSFSVNTQTVLKLAFLSKAIEFQSEQDFQKQQHDKNNSILRELYYNLNIMITKDDKMVYQYTSAFVYELINGKKHLLIHTGDNYCLKLIERYLRIKLKYQSDFDTDKLDWNLIIKDSGLINQNSNQNNNNDFDDDIILLMDDISVKDDSFICDKIIHILNEPTEDLLSYWNEDFFLRKLSSIIELMINNELQDSKALITSILEYFVKVTKQSEVLLSKNHFALFDSIVLLIKAMDPVQDFKLIDSSLDLLFQIFKSESRPQQYLQFNKIRNLSNLLFNSGGKLLTKNFRESLNHWMNSINYEYCIVINDKIENKMKNFEFFQTKIDRITNLLIENRNYSESMLFLSKVFKCYMNLSNPEINKSDGFFTLQNRFNKDLSVTIKLLIKSVVLSKKIDLSMFEEDEFLKAFIVTNIFKALSIYSAEEKTSLVNSLMEQLKQTVIDRGLYQYCLISYYNISGLESFIHINYEEFQEKKFPVDSCIYYCKELIVCYNYLQYSINRKFNQAILMSCLELFVKWLNKKPTSTISNNERLIEFEFEFLQYLISYLQYQKLNSYLIFIVKTYKQSRTLLINHEQSLFLEFKLCESFSFIKFSKRLSNELTSIGSILKDHKSAIFETIKWKLLQFEYCLLIGNLSNAREKYSTILRALQISEDFKLTSELTKFKVIKILTVFSKFSYLSGLLNFELNNFSESILNVKRAIRISQSILKKFMTGVTNIDIVQYNNIKWELTHMTISFYKCIVEVMVHCGLTKEAVYYLEELAKFMEFNDRIPLVQCDVYYFTAEFYLLCGEKLKANQLMVKGDEIYNELIFSDKYLELKGTASHAFYMQTIEDDKNEKIYYDMVDTLFEKLFKSYNYKNDVNSRDIKTFSLNDSVSSIWNMHSDELQLFARMKLQIEHRKLLKLNMSDDTGRILNAKLTNSDHKLHFQYDLLINNVIGSKKNLAIAKKSLSTDPVLSGLDDSAILLPSTMMQLIDNAIHSPEVSKRLTAVYSNNINVKKALKNLTQSRDLVVNSFEKALQCFKIYELYDLNKTLMASLSTLSAISTSQIRVDLLQDIYFKDEVPRFLPFMFQKKLVDLTEDSKKLLPDDNIQKQNSIAAAENSTSFFKKIRSYLPANWLVITIDVCPYNGDLLLTRLERNSTTPFIIRLPLNRHSARDLCEKSFTFDDALKELKIIINDSDATTKIDRTSTIVTSADKETWWNERKELDSKLGKLMSDAEYCWLGGFKGIFNQKRVNRTLMGEFKDKFTNILNRYLPSRKKARLRNKTSNIVEVDDKVLELFASLGHPSNLSSTELLEDLIYFVLDILLFHGEENAFDEIDIDQMYVEIEELLDNYHTDNFFDNFDSFTHTVLVVSKSCQQFPWESLPSLRDCSISRTPSLQMLLNHLESQLLGDTSKKLLLEKTNGYYILNPSGDLIRTEQNFKSKFAALVNWKGIIGRRPEEIEFQKGLRDSDLFVYLGHGSGDQYIRSKSLKELSNCPPSLLLGCSSGLLKDNGMLEPYGTVFNYLIGGSPMVLVNLWDVTDKDIDKFSLSVFEKWGLFENNVKSENICQAVSSSRDVCHLKYLNGSAPIVYGLPYYL